MCNCTFTFDCLIREYIYSLGLKLGSTLPPHSFRGAYINSLEKIIIRSPGHDFSDFRCWQKECSLEACKRRPYILQSCANAFTIPNQTTQIIEDLGCQVMFFLFGDKHADSLKTMRYNIFSKKVVSSSSFVSPERLPPNKSATRLYCRRVYYQIMVLMGMEEGMDAMNWGWTLLVNRFVPLMSRMNAAPDSLLKVIRCNCYAACKTLRCLCRGYGLPCATVCGPCQLEECDNPHNTFLPEESDDEDEQCLSVYCNVLMGW